MIASFVQQEGPSKFCLLWKVDWVQELCQSLIVFLLYFLPISVQKIVPAFQEAADPVTRLFKWFEGTRSGEKYRCV